MRNKDKLLKQLHDQIRLEMRFNHVNYDYTKPMNEIKLLIENMLLRLINAENKIIEMYKIRQSLKRFQFSDDIVTRMVDIANIQKSIIEKEKGVKHAPKVDKSTVLNYQAGGGEDIKGTFDIRIKNIIGKILKFLAITTSLLINNSYANQKSNINILQKEITREFIKNDSLLLENNSRIFRNYTLNILSDRSNISGWVISTVFDKRTCPICISKRYDFYSAREYSREQAYVVSGLPFHPNCRCVLLEVYGYTSREMSELRNDRRDLDTFLRRNRKDAEFLLGKKKTKILYENKNIKGEDLYDYRNQKLYTNKQLAKKYKLDKKYYT